MKVLVVGLGSIAKKHIVALRRIDPSVELYAMRSGKGNNSLDGITNLYDWNQLASIRFDFAIISNPTSEHIPAIRELLPFRLPLFIEKPLHTGVIDDELIDEIKRWDIITYIACNLRFLGCLQEAAGIIGTHRVNEVNVYCGSYLPDWRPQIDYHAVYSAIPEMGGGVHLDLIHEMDYIYWLFGKPQRTHHVFTHKSSLDIRAYDYANYLMEYPQFNVNVILNYYRREYKRTLELVCSDGTFLVDLAANAITCGNQILFSSAKGIADTYLSQMEYFIECVSRHRHTINDMEDANNVLKISLQNDIER
ncbi:Gfo/Idh/MocA family oxidoreductase [uncultured Bacteroides sp.]|uniref:Gfo/Idh/MocA family protein n=1 Tax=uncultured Bacteroides sp. TaxID=162156 RepID=UPI0025E73F26|nr:Gfo/Idh/MocA family oxidoreductase [uncultured Bacteroides sp.]